MDEIRITDENIFIKIINRAANVDMLKDIPFRPFANNLAITYRALVHKDVSGIASFAITNSMMEQGKWSEESLHSLAMKNSKKLFPGECIELQKMVFELMDGEFGSEPLPDMEIPVCILTNESRINGASCLVDTEFLDKVSEERFGGKNFKILPSSVHEVLAVPDELETSELLEMVVDANKTVVEPNDRLADAVYHYDANKKIVNCIAVDVPLRPGPGLSL